MVNDWQRIDDRPIRNTGGCNDIPGAIQRVYGLGGKLWPRMSVAVWPDDQNGEKVLVVAIGRKDRSGSWWESCRGTPVSLIGDLVEMIREMGLTQETSRVFESGECWVERDGQPVDFESLVVGEIFRLNYTPRGGTLGETRRVVDVGREGANRYVDYVVVDSREGHYD